MKKLLIVCSLLLITTAAHGQSMNCSAWIGMFGKSMHEDDSAGIKTLYLAGFSDGIASGIAVSLPKEQHAGALNQVWPAGLDIQRLRVLLDDYCRRPENKDLPMMVAIHKITQEINERRKP